MTLQLPSFCIAERSSCVYEHKADVMLNLSHINQKPKPIFKCQWLVKLLKCGIVCSHPSSLSSRRTRGVQWLISVFNIRSACLRRLDKPSMLSALQNGVYAKCLQRSEKSCVIYSYVVNSLLLCSFTDYLPNSLMPHTDVACRQTDNIEVNPSATIQCKNRATIFQRYRYRRSQIIKDNSELFWLIDKLITWVWMWCNKLILPILVYSIPRTNVIPEAGAENAGPENAGPHTNVRNLKCMRVCLLA